jgi:hypothetical protein
VHPQIAFETHWIRSSQPCESTSGCTSGRVQAEEAMGLEREADLLHLQPQTLTSDKLCLQNNGAETIASLQLPSTRCHAMLCNQMSSPASQGNLLASANGTNQSSARELGRCQGQHHGPRSINPLQFTPSLASKHSSKGHIQTAHRIRLPATCKVECTCFTQSGSPVPPSDITV